MKDAIKNNIIVILLSILILCFVIIAVFCITSDRKEEKSQNVAVNVDETFEKNVKKYVDNALYNFMMLVENGNYDEAYKFVSAKTKQNKFNTVEDFAFYAIENFLRNSGKQRDFIVEKVKKEDTNKYMATVIFGNASDTIEVDNNGNIKESNKGISEYKLLFNFIEGSEDLTNFEITFE